MVKKDVQLGEVLFEFSTQGNFVKVVAVDPITNTEISMVGDRKAGRKALERTAIQKLKYVIGKRLKEEQSASAAKDENLY